MNWLDLAILGVIGLSALISLLRGFVREVLSVLVWVLAFWLSLRFAGDAAAYLEAWIASPTIRLGAAFAAIFVATLVGGALVNQALVTLVGRTGLSGTDRLLGAVFGAGRGAVVVAAVVLLLGVTPMTEERGWRESTLLPGIQPWLCRIGADRWLARLSRQVPLPGGEEAEGLERLPSYWTKYCAGKSGPE